ILEVSFLLCLSCSVSLSAFSLSEQVSKCRHSVSCPPVFACIKYSSSPLFQHFCLQSGANLASVHSLDEYKFMQDLVLARTGEYTRTWIGGSDAIQNNVWMWSDGSRFDFQGWGWGEPNNHQGRESCVEINYGGTRWNDWACEDQFPFVCVKKLNC
uniref:C-type lectin domain-containing protein n=1 Tax=Myripristis murdjan TaxID=586833 RepID=A0A667YV90_9TELE